MSTPKSVWTKTGVEISVDPNGPLLQLGLSDRREGAAAWRLITDLTVNEVAELRDHLSNWLAGDL